MIVGAALTLAGATAAVWLGDAWWPLAGTALVPLALAWALIAALGGARCLPLAGAPWADPVHWGARAAMLPMLAGLPAMNLLCSAAGWSTGAMLALHALAMLAPMALPLRSAVGRGPVAAAMLASAGVLLWQPGVVGWMGASGLQALACGLAMRRPPAATPGSALPASVLVTLALGAALADGGPALLMQLQLVLGLAAPAALLVPAVRHCGPSPSREAMPPG